MLLCPTCQSEYGEGAKFCRQCGSPLRTRDGSLPASERFDFPDRTKARTTFLCPKCRVRYGRGTFCRQCGCRLIEETVSTETEEDSLPVAAPPADGTESPLPDREHIKHLAEQESELSQEKKKFESLIADLEDQRETLPEDVFRAKFEGYHAKLEEVSSRCDQVGTELKAVGDKALDEIDRLTKGLAPIHQRLDELASLHRSRSIQENAFINEKSELENKIKEREKEIKGYQQLVSLLPYRQGEVVGPPERGRSFLRPLLLAAGGLVIVVAVAGYLVWPSSSDMIKELFPSRSVMTKDLSTKTLQASSPAPSPASAQEEIAKIRSLLETIKQANLTKDIDLFISCYAVDFKDRDGKKQSTLETWRSLDFVALSYDLQQPAISGNTATARVEWTMKTSDSKGGPLEEDRTVLGVTLKKEKGDWKIKEVKP